MRLDSAKGSFQLHELSWKHLKNPEKTAWSKLKLTADPPDTAQTFCVNQVLTNFFWLLVPHWDAAFFLIAVIGWKPPQNPRVKHRDSHPHRYQRGNHRTWDTHSTWEPKFIYFAQKMTFAIRLTQKMLRVSFCQITVTGSTIWIKKTPSKSHTLTMMWLSTWKNVKNLTT